MAAKVLYLPRTDLNEGEYDPNLSNRFSGEEVREIWMKIDSLALEEVARLVLKHQPNLAKELSQEMLAMRVAKIASFFLRESARRVNFIAYTAVANLADGTLAPEA